MEFYKSYETLTEAINALRKEGYAEDFNLMHDSIGNREYKISSSEFKIDKFYRFEGDTDPADECVIYAISSETHALKGILVNAFGTYADPIASEIIEKLKMR